MQHVIIGNGAAGVTAAARLREIDKSCEITVLSSEEVPAYAKIMLPDYIGGKMGREKLLIRDTAFYLNNDIQLKLSSKVIGIDTENHLVKLEGDASVSYDRVLLAAGGVPFVPDTEGLESIIYFKINSLSDADGIKSIAAAGKTAVIAGGGLTGIEMGFALGRLGLRTYIVEKADNLLPVQLDREASEVMEAELKKSSVSFIPSTNVTRVLTIGNQQSPAPQCRVELSNGSTIDADMLIYAIGTRPNTGFLKGSEISINRGVLVNEKLESKVKGVYAAGDMAELVNAAAGGYVSSYIWPNAMAQGKCAASNMAGLEQVFSNEAAALNMVQLRDMQYVSMGLVKPADNGYELLVRKDTGNGIYKRIVIKEDKIVGMVFMGDNTSANTIAGLIRKGININGTRHRLLEEGFRLN